MDRDNYLAQSHYEYSQMMNTHYSLSYNANALSENSISIDVRRFNAVRFQFV